MSSKTIVNAHDLFDLVASRADGWSAKELKAATAEQFGEDICFHTCSESDLTLRDLVEIAFDSGRLILDGDRIKPGRNGCTHK